jgi:4-amino-4-deoxy-L-arabinose transferase-like glycosyltransferase
MIPLPSLLPSPRSRRLYLLILFLVLALGAFLRFYNLEATGDGNPYYAATVKSMLTSWHNFFFASFEPGGSVTVDKPPLGFWMQAASATIFGFNGFALAFPNALGGVLSIFLIYKLVHRPFGEWPALIAALALAVMPVAVSAERNNTIDGLLVFVLLCAAWAFLEAVYTGKLRCLLLGALLVGLGFNIKMLQAFLPLPAFYAVYFFGAKHGWGKKILHLTAASLLLVVVSFSWAVAVDLTPAENRPYIGSSSDNTVMELIFGHNGISRIISTGMGRIRNAQDRPPRPGPMQPGTGNPYPLPGGQIPVQPLPPLGPGAKPPPGGQNPLTVNNPQLPVSTGPGMDSGTAGPLRLFTEPLVGEASWLLPFALAGIIVMLFVLRRLWPLTDRHVGLILWAGWLLPEAFYFTFSQGLMHAYYMIMLGPPIAALAGMTAWALERLIERKPLPGWSMAALLGIGTLAFQLTVMWDRAAAAPAVLLAALLFLVGAALCLAVLRDQEWVTRLGLSLLLASTLLAPLTWSLYTTINPGTDGHLPYSGPVRRNSLGAGDDRQTQALVDFLLANTPPDQYLLATNNANQATPFILATGRPVLTFGGFTGSDDIIDAAGLAEMVASGQLRFVLDQGINMGKSDIKIWLAENCRTVDTRQFIPAAAGPQPPVVNLYDCGQ